MQHHALRFALALALSVIFPLPAFSNGGERVLLIVDPEDPESMYVANYYREQRGVPATNFVYMSPDASNYTQFADVNIEGMFGDLANRRVTDQVDFIVIPPGGNFYVSAPGLVSDPCFPINRFSISSAYTFAFLKNLKNGGASWDQTNHFRGTNWNPAAFSSTTRWLNGNPSTSINATPYFIGAMLGYTGLRGNTLAEILDMIDRSVAADGTHPVGTAYYMRTTDTARSSPRHSWYPTAVAEMGAAGGSALRILDVLPLGNHDATGVMTGWATPDIDGADFSLLDGSFADHLTSFAGRFDTASQTKMSRWIAKGASGTSGAVEEPCNDGGKFPHARLHVLYYKGATLGEAWFRSMLYRPYQQLLYGDPLTQPYASFPTVDVPTPPASPASGLVTISPTQSATAPGASIASVELLVDGVSTQTIAAGEDFQLNTTLLADGWHELRVIAIDDTNVRNRGRWIGSLETQNRGYSVTLGSSPLAGDLNQRFDLSVSAAGPATIQEVRLVQNGRVVAASASASATLGLYGQNLGAGPVRIQAEALFTNGERALSPPVDLDVTYASGPPVGLAPVAFGYTKRSLPDQPFVIELPAAHDDDFGGATYTIVQAPTQGTILSTGLGPYRTLDPDPGAKSDTLTFQVTTPSGSSSVATVTLEYGLPRARIYGCGLNPAGSLQVLGGTPSLGSTVILGLDDPGGSLPAGSIPLLIQSLAPARPYPCGIPYGRGDLRGEILLSFTRADLVSPALVGPAWNGPGSPSAIDVAIPNDCNLLGTSIYLQGLLRSTGPRVRTHLLEAIELEVGL